MLKPIDFALLTILSFLFLLKYKLVRTSKWFLVNTWILLMMLTYPSCYSTLPASFTVNNFFTTLDTFNSWVLHVLFFYLLSVTALFRLLKFSS